MGSNTTRTSERCSGSIKADVVTIMDSLVGKSIPNEFGYTFKIRPFNNGKNILIIVNSFGDIHDKYGIITLRIGYLHILESIKEAFKKHSITAAICLDYTLHYKLTEVESIHYMPMNNLTVYDYFDKIRDYVDNTILKS
jgi:hypothetical protein